ncbi:hypothetical protein ALC57_14689 [Trachymyrmex cornetzi]|uniref:Uncharacterized protein n=1 Tax=Trachymyrmex cornetzi TaxID=471704 RepID=A0A151IXW1_9HYME|nr:hypothetical protein ALC57_14689 [Trachymyrmex cornetzi]
MFLFSGTIFLPDKLNAARYTDFLETEFFDYLEDIHLEQKKRFQRLPATETPRNRRQQSGEDRRDRE